MNDDTDIERQCRVYGQRHSGLKPDTFADVVNAEPAIKTAQQREWCWDGYRTARACRPGVLRLVK